MIKKALAASAVALSMMSGPALAEDTTVFEIAWFKLNPGTESATMMKAAQHVQDHFLPKFDGRIYRELMQQDGGDYWIDSIHWRALGDFEKAAAEILTDPNGAPIMELIDLSSMAWFHADRVRKWDGDVPQGDGFTEIQFFRLVAPGSEIEFLVPTTDEEFLEAAEAIQEKLSAQSGFGDRELFRTADGWWIDLIHWNSKADADNAKAIIMADMAEPESVAMSFFNKIDPKSLKTFNMNQKKVW
ncbi:antibiotic biosynthesis monooxygenase family protein [Roseibium sp.]|uniref:antibiotic biosynthesis monooxygenase family protein n=1 Tax=Roseibium sp. TaxID=1936156 RepID=UPI003B52837C